MPPRNIAAFTASESEYPAFISINHADEGSVSISIRSAKKLSEDHGYNVPGNDAEIILTRDEFAKLLEEAGTALKAEA